MLWKKIKKNTYYFFKLKKKIDTSSISSSGKKSFSVKEKSFRGNKNLIKNQPLNQIQLALI